MRGGREGEREVRREGVRGGGGMGNNKAEGVSIHE